MYPNHERETHLTARHQRETLIGCLGIACVLLFAPLLWLAVGAPTPWLARLAPLAGAVVVMAGITLMLRVPGSDTPRSRDPHKPLTRAGALPVVERPATLATRASLALAIALAALTGGGYFIAALAGAGKMVWALPVSLISGLALFAQGALARAGRFPAPALRWQRLTITGGALGRGASLSAAGLTGVGATLLLATLDGDSWGFVGISLLLMAVIALAPFARRAPDAIWRSEQSVRQREDVE
jgi:hypothetical protein